MFFLANFSTSSPIPLNNAKRLQIIVVLPVLGKISLLTVLRDCIFISDELLLVEFVELIELADATIFAIEFDCELTTELDKEIRLELVIALEDDSDLELIDELEIILEKVDDDIGELEDIGDRLEIILETKVELVTVLENEIDAELETEVGLELELDFKQFPVTIDVVTTTSCCPYSEEKKWTSGDPTVDSLIDTAGLASVLVRVTVWYSSDVVETNTPLPVALAPIFQIEFVGVPVFTSDQPEV